MASPFKAFRKNQKIMMAVITILAMFAFLFFGPWSRLGDPTTSYKNPEVFTWKYGTVTEADLHSAIMARNAVQTFLYRLSVEIGRSEADSQDLVRRQFAQPSEASVIQSMLLAKKAEQMGIHVSDEMVKNYLEAWTENRQIRSDQFAQVLNSVAVPDMKSRGQRRLKQSELFDTLRTELAAMYGRYMFFPLFTRANYFNASFAGDTPADRWHYYCQVNRKATAQILPVAVADFVSEIADPSEGTLNDFYEQYKNQDFYPESPTPGFHQPYRAQIQYFKADYEKMMAAEKPKVTEQEIKDYYETNKDRDFRKSRFSDSPADEAGESGEKKQSDATPSADSPMTPSDSEKADEKSTPPGDKSPASTDGKPNATKASDNTTAPPKQPEGEAGDANKQPPANAPAPPAEDKTAPDGKKSSQSKPAASLDDHLLAFADEALLAQAAPQAKAPDGKTAEEAKAAATEPPGEQSAEAKATESKDAEPKAAEPKATEPPPAETNTSDAKTTETPTPPATSTVPPVEYEPLEKVADQIRQAVARQKVESQIEKTFTALLEKMKKYSSELGRSRVKLGPVPAPLDFKALAQEHSIDALETPLITARQAFDETGGLGKSRGLLTFSNPQPPRFIDVAFASKPALPTFDPKESEDNDRNRYLWWKIADEQPHTPPLADIKPEVVKAWKMIEARKPAKAKAEKLAEEVRKSKLPIREAMEGTKNADVITAGPFSWLDRGMFRQAPQIAKVAGVEMPGPDFMKTVFSLEPKETAVTSNLPENIYYVVQVESFEPPLDILENGFMTAMANPSSAQEYAVVGAQEHYYDDRAWFKELQDQFNFQFAPRSAVKESNDTGEGE